MAQDVRGGPGLEEAAVMKARFLAAAVATVSVVVTLAVVWSPGEGAVPAPPGHTPTPTATPLSAAAEPQTEREPEEPSALAHRLVVLDRFLCSSCHRLDGGWTVPEDHAELTEGDCESCHVRAAEPPATTVHRIPDLEKTSQALCSACHGDLTGVVALAPKIADAGECSSCHSGDDPAALPEDHESRSLTTCMVCHKTEFLEAASVPHQAAGWEECSFCHGDGRLTPLAGGHTEITVSECLDCHEDNRSPPGTPEQMLHASHEGEGCASCHAEGKLAPPPTDHQGRDEVLCAVCHAPALDRAPLAPHTLPEQGACDRCHGAGSDEGAPRAPEKYSALASEACSACHRGVAGGVPLIEHSAENRQSCTDCHHPRTIAPGG